VIEIQETQRPNNFYPLTSSILCSSCDDFFLVLDNAGAAPSAYFLVAHRDYGKRDVKEMD
jgi:hypothetical protein